MNAYQERKAKVRQKAIDFQIDSSDKNYSWGEITERYAYFERAGRKYGLLKEFRENGIL